MAEPATSAVGAVSITAAGLTIFGVVTGLDPGLLIAGLAGGLWSLRYLEPMSVWQRATTAALSALVAAWGAPVAVALITSAALWPKDGPEAALGFASALGLGLLAHTVIGPTLIRVTRRKAQEVAGE